MSEGLGPEARALLDAARGQLAPDAATVRRMRGQLDVAMTRAAVQAARASKLGLGAKLAGVALAVVAAGTVAYVRNADEPSEPRGSGAAVVHTREAPVVAPARAPVAAASVPAAVTRKREPAVAAAPVVPRAAAHDPAPATAHVSPAPASPAPASLTREVELVDLAMAALRGGDPRTALRTVAVHARETAGHGQLAEDAAAIEVEALCQLGDAAVSDKLAAFDRRFPRSAQRARLTAACR